MICSTSIQTYCLDTANLLQVSKSISELAHFHSTPLHSGEENTSHTGFTSHLFLNLPLFANKTLPKQTESHELMMHNTPELQTYINLRDTGYWTILTLSQDLSSWPAHCLLHCLPLSHGTVLTAQHTCFSSAGANSASSTKTLMPNGAIVCRGTADL